LAAQVIWRSASYYRRSIIACLVIEKPIGHDLDSAHAINGHLASIFDESQIYRIDHYLGKETVEGSNNAFANRKTFLAISPTASVPAMWSSNAFDGP